MMNSFLIFTFLLFCSVGCYQTKLKLAIYYETLCRDSIDFFKTQLNRTYERIGSHIDIELIPYGFANHKKVNDKWTFQCQHGERECNANKYHACELAQGFGVEKDVKFIGCSMSSSNPASVAQLRKCAESVGIDFVPISECFENGQGDELLVNYGKKTQAVKPKIKYIPTIIVNDIYDANVQRSAEFHLLPTICGLETMPTGC